MQTLRLLTEGDQELTSFLQGMRATLVVPPTGAVATALPARLAAEARAGGPSAAPSTNGHGRTNGRGPASERPRRAPWRPVLRVAVAVAAIPLLFTGLAFAGVKLPDPATSAFESIGIDLPNQADEGGPAGASGDDDDAGTAHDGDSAGSETGQSNSSGKLDREKAQQNPDRAEGQPDNGRADGQAVPVPGGGEPPADVGGGSGGSGSGGDNGVNPGDNPGGKPESPPGGGPPDSVGPPETPGSQGKPPRGVQKKGSSGSGGGALVDPGAAGGKPNGKK